MLLPLQQNNLGEPTTEAPGDVPVEAAFVTAQGNTQTEWTINLSKFGGTTVNGIILKFYEEVSGGAPQRSSIGVIASFGDIEGEFCYAWSDKDNASTTAAQHRHRTGCCGMLIDPDTGAVDIIIKAISVSPTEIRLRPLDADGVPFGSSDGLSYGVQAYVMGGSARFEINHTGTGATKDVAKKVYCGNLPGAPRTVAILGNLSNLTTTWAGGDDSGAQADSIFAMGFAIDDGNGGVAKQAGQSHKRKDGRVLGLLAPTSPGQYVLDSEVTADIRCIRYAKWFGGEFVPASLEVTAMDEDTTGPYFEVTPRDVSSGWEFGYIAIYTHAADFAVKTIEMAVSSGVDSDINLGISPAGFMALISTSLYSSRHSYDTASAAAGACGLLMTHGSDAQGGRQLSTGHQFQNNLTTVTNAEHNNHQTDLIDLERHTGATGLLGTFGADGLTATGFDYTTTAWIGSNSRAWVVWAIGDLQITPDGIAATASLGPIDTVIAAAPSGVLAAGSLGPINLALQVALEGLTAVGSLGPIDVSLQLVPDGVLAVGELGDVDAQFFATVGGIAATGTLGDIGATLAVVVGGLSATGSVGPIDATLALTLDGVVATGLLGDVSVVMTAVPDGILATVVLGDVSALTETLSRGSARGRIVFGGTVLGQLVYGGTTRGLVAVGGTLAGRFVQAAQARGIVVSGLPIAGRLAQAGTARGRLVFGGTVAGRAQEAGVPAGLIVFGGSTAGRVVASGSARGRLAFGGTVAGKVR